MATAWRDDPRRAGVSLPASPLFFPSPAAEKARSVIITAGFRCRDGVVLSADAGPASPGMPPTGSRIRALRQLRCRPVLVSAGNSGFDSQATEAVAGAISTAEQEGNDVVESIHQTIRDIHRTWSATPAQGGQRRHYFSSLITLSLSGGLRLFSVAGPTLAPVKGYTCISGGPGAEGCVAKMVFDADLEINEAVYAARYLTFIANECDLGSHGESRILTLHDGPPTGRSVEPADWSKICQESLEPICRMFHREVEDMAREWGGMNHGGEDFQQSLARFVRSLTVHPHGEAVGCSFHKAAA